MIIAVFQWLGVLMIIGSIGLVVYNLRQRDEDDGVKRAKKSPSYRVKWPVIMGIVGLILLIWMGTGAAWVPATGVAVVENTVNGSLSGIGPGTHVFPFESKLIPFVTKVTKYDLMRQTVEIGVPTSPDPGKFIQTAIEADSNSPGRPKVYFYARGWAYPNKDQITELHRRYGSKYIETWVDRVWIATLKSVQGQNEYSYVGNNRIKFEQEVEKRLQSQLLNDNGEPIVYVSQLAVVNFDFTDATKQYLQTVQQVEFERQKADMQIQVNEKTQLANKTSADTSYIVETRNAERDRDAKISRANGDAKEKTINADAEAYKVRVGADAEAYRLNQTYTAESEGIKKVQTSLAQSPAGYLEYQRNKQWNGQLPQYMMGSGGAVPFIDLSPGKTGLAK